MITVKQAQETLTREDEAALKSQAERLGLTDRVRFLGAVPHDRLPIVLNAADVFVLPSSSEGLANAWVEALACGTPVVTTPIPGARELLTDPAWGRMVARDKLAIAIAVDQLLAILDKNFEWKEGAAKEQLFKIFEALGPKSDIVKEGRRRLSALRFR